MGTFDAPAALWARERVARGDVPTLQEALICCDATLLVRAIREEHAGGEGGALRGAGVAAERRRVGELELAEGLWRLCEAPVKRTCGRERLLLPAESFAPRSDGEGLVRSVRMRLLEWGDEACARRVLAAGGAEAADGARASRETTGMPCRELVGWPRADALASRVWLGGPWSECERHRALACAAWELLRVDAETGGCRGGVAPGVGVAGVGRRGDANAGIAATEALAEGEALGGRCIREGPSAGRGERLEVARRRDGPYGASSVSGYWELRAAELGLRVPDRYEDDGRAALAACARRLNEGCELDLCRRFLDALERMGVAGGAG